MIWLILLVASGFVYFYIKKSLQYWENKGVAYVKPTFFKTASSQESVEKSVIEVYNKFSGERYYGIYRFLEPVLVVRDPELIKNIAVKWFEEFGDHKGLGPENIDDIWSKNMFALKIENGWRDIRTTVSASFTNSKLKTIFDLIKQCTEQCVEHYAKQKDQVEVEAKDFFTRLAIDIIANTSFAINCNSSSDPQNTFYLMGYQMVDFSGIKAYKFLAFNLMPFITKLLGIKMFNNTLRKYFSGLLKETIQLRRENKIRRSDMIHLLMESQKKRLNNDASVNVDAGFASVNEFDISKSYQKGIALTDDYILALVLGSFIAAADTTSSVMCFVTYELAVNPDIQNRLYEDIYSAVQNDDGKLTYESVLGIKYLDMVVCETMRKWPTAWFLDRICRKSFIIEPENKNEKPLLVEKGTQCHLSVMGIHRDPKYYPDPDKFDPERFSDENKHNIQPYTYMPFGVGPRNCMGSRYALLQMKLAITEILLKFEIVPVKKTAIPLVIQPRGLGFSPKNGYCIGLKPRT